MEAFAYLFSTLSCFLSKPGTKKLHPKADPSARPKWNDGDPKFERREGKRRINDRNDALALGLGYGGMSVGQGGGTV